MPADLQVINAVLWFALEKSAGQQTKNLRKPLIAGSKTPVCLNIDGTVDGKPIGAAIRGNLTVAHDGAAQTTVHPDPAHILALAMARMPKTKRGDFLAAIAATAGAALPDADAELLASVTDLLSKLERKVLSPRKGAVSFVQPIPEDAAVAKAA